MDALEGPVLHGRGQRSPGLQPDAGGDGLPLAGYGELDVAARMSARSTTGRAADHRYGDQGHRNRYRRQCHVVWRGGWWSRTGGVAACREQVGAGVGAGEEAEASPFGEFGEHVAGLDTELVCEFAGAPGSARVVFHERSDGFSSGWGRVRVARLAVSGSPCLVEAGRVQDDLMRTDSPWRLDRRNHRGGGSARVAGGLTCCAPGTPRRSG
jgi:hypothetical protein